MVKWNNRGWTGKKTNYQEVKELIEVVKKKGTNRTPVISVCLCEEKEAAWTR